MGFFGCYTYPDYTSTIKHVVTAIGQFPHWDALLVAGHFNLDLVTPKGNCLGEEISSEIVTAGLEEISAHFIP